MTAEKKQIGSGNLLFVRISYGIGFALFLGLGIYFGQIVLIIVTFFCMVTMSLIHLRLDWYIFIVSDGFLIENVIGQKKKFGFELYKGISIEDSFFARLGLNNSFLFIDFLDGSSFQFLSNKNPNAMDKEIRELISSHNMANSKSN